MLQQQSRINLEMKESLENGLEFSAPYNWPQNGNAVPICKSTGAFVCSTTKLWNSSTSWGRIFCQLYFILYASSYNFSAEYDALFWDMLILLCHYTTIKHGEHFYRIFLKLHLYVGLYAFTPTLNCASCPLVTITWGSNLLSTKCTFQCKKDNKMLVLIEQFYSCIS